MAIEIVVSVHYNQLNAVREINRIDPAGLDRYSFVLVAVNDGDRGRGWDRLKIAKPIFLKVISDENLFPKCIVENWCSTSVFPLFKFLL
jgi:hypothetical protein